MGLFDWFRPKPTGKSNALPDVIWLTKPAKFAGLSRAVNDALAGPEPPDAVLLVAHFRDCLGELQKLVDEGRVAGPVAVVRADEFQDTTAGMALDESRLVLIVVGERHPLRSHDEDVAEFAENLPCRCRLVHHVSLDDPLMRAFAGERVVAMLRGMGMKEHEPIDSPVVTCRVKDAQKKLAGRYRSDFPADSAEEWMRRNCPEF